MKRRMIRPILQPILRSPFDAGVGGAWSPESLFASSEQGAWYDPSDLSTMYQDSAGTTAAVVNQPVGRILDKSGNGNHATQATTANKPILRESGGLYYLQFDGIDDGLATGSIDFTGTDKMTVFAGVRKLSDAATAVVVELSTTSVNSNMFAFYAPNGAAPNVVFLSKGTATGLSTFTVASPSTLVVTGIADVSGDYTVVRANGVAGTPSLADQGTGNYGNYPTYLGRRAGASLPFNGHLYQLIIRGAATDADGITNGETFTNTKTGAY